jgi:CubicO group peptidase (beta-lactamase class C family)
MVGAAEPRGTGEDPRPSRRAVLGGLAALGVASVIGACSSGDGADASATTSTTRDQPSSTTPDGTDPTSSTAAYVPPPDVWESVDPAAEGWSPEAIEELASFLESQSSRTFILLSGGRIAAEHYWGGAEPDSVQDIASCQKSIVSTLCGVAVDRGLVGIDDPVTDHLGSGWSNADAVAERAITIRHLLSMTSGLDQATLAATAPPGAAWAYNTTAYQKLRPVLESAAGSDIETITRDWLWEPIGVSTTSRWRERPGAGPMQRDATGAPLWSLEMTARDLARFGLLVQRAGTWGDEEVVSSSWLVDARAPSQDLNPAYGYLWWVGGAMGRPTMPPDLVAALGALDQKVYISDDADFVVVRQGGAANESTEATSSFDVEILDRVVAAR